MKELISIIIMVISSLFAAVGQLSLKIGSMKLERTIRAFIQNYAFLVGVLFYGVATVLGIVALKGNELSVLYPIASLNYVWVSLLSMKYLNERMNAHKWAGIVLIIIGVIIIL
jgi:uncharacterized membrane protein